MAYKSFIFSVTVKEFTTAYLKKSILKVIIIYVRSSYLISSSLNGSLLLYYLSTLYTSYFSSAYTIYLFQYFLFTLRTILRRLRRASRTFSLLTPPFEFTIYSSYINTSIYVLFYYLAFLP